MRANNKGHSRVKNNSMILRTDGYKMSHHLMYPPGMDSMYSYMEARNRATFPKTIFFGLRYYIENYLAHPFDMIDVEDGRKFAAEYFQDDSIYPYDGLKYIVDKHNGIFPVRIMSVPEGTMVDRGNVLCTVESTDRKVPWVVNYVEPLLLKVWYTSTVATLSWSIRTILAKFLHGTVGSLDGLEYMLHDFSYRGASSEETAALCGAAHLLSFVGSDNIQGDFLLRRNYDSGRVVARSIPAAEHSTITAWGPGGEAAAYRHIITAFPNGTVAVVSDSYDIYNACKQIWGTELHDEVMGRDGRVVIRPDSGSPVESVVVKVLDALRSKFGTTKTEKGYLVLPQNVRVIQGDGVNAGSIERILFNMELSGYAASNVAFGMGGALASAVTRDTQDFATKCSSVTINGEMRDVFKTPIGQKSKASKRGRMKLVLSDNGVCFTVPESSKGENVMRLLYEDGFLHVKDTYDQIRNRIP